MAYGQTKSTKGAFGKMASSLKYSVTIADKTDTGSVMDTQRPVNPQSPFFPINGAFKSPTTRK